MLEHLERPVRRLVVVDSVPVVANAADCVLEKVEQHLLALELAARRAVLQIVDHLAYVTSHDRLVDLLLERLHPRAEVRDLECPPLKLSPLLFDDSFQCTQLAARGRFTNVAIIDVRRMNQLSIFAQSPRTTTKIAEALDTGTQMARAISEVITLVHIVTAIVAKGSDKIDASQICRGATRLKALEPELPMNVPRCAVGLIEHRCHVDCSKVELDTPPIEAEAQRPRSHALLDERSDVPFTSRHRLPHAALTVASIHDVEPQL